MLYYCKWKEVLIISEKTINFKIDEELYKKLKIKIATEDTTIKQFLIELIKKSLEVE